MFSRISARIVLAFCAAMFLSASLLFFVQPLFAKMVLPRIGGAAAVWTTAMLFFQAVLIAGYLYAHLLTRYLPVKAQLAVHIGFWALALVFLPLSVPADWQFDPQKSTVTQTLVLFALGVGVPFAFLSANAPLIQSWYTRTSGPSSDDPYFLYAASNLGSLLALLAFPFIAEPLWSLSQIRMGWAVGFLALGLGILACGLMTNPRLVAQQPQDHSPRKPLSAKQIGFWIFAAAVPSSLMLSITTKISTDLGSFPMLWVIPLALYIMSFIPAFSAKIPFGREFYRFGAYISLGLLLVLISEPFGTVTMLWSLIPFAATLFLIAVEAHRQLYESRPDPQNLTVFYLMMSVGGAIGGLFNSIIAPMIFVTPAEVVCSVIAASALMSLHGKMQPARSEAVLVIGCFLIVVLFKFSGYSEELRFLTQFALFGLLFLAFYRLKARPLPAVALVLVAIGMTHSNNAVHRERSFFGTHVVREFGNVRTYSNGTTVHGRQYISEPGDRPQPLSYYHRTSPMGQTLENAAPDSRIGVVGLGIGALACYKKPNQEWHFYEIDKAMEEIARNPEWFGYMDQCGQDMDVHLGDARITLAQQTLTFDYLVLDAYSSDAVPLHLTTREAVELYLERLTDDGVLLLHISNRHFDLYPPIRRIADSLGLAARIYSFEPDDDNGADGSIVVAVARKDARLQQLPSPDKWQNHEVSSGAIWTDDHANILSALK